MLQGLNLGINRNSLPTGANVISTSQPISVQNFRDVLSGFRQNSVIPAVGHGSTRDSIFDAISQTRANIATAFTNPTSPAAVAMVRTITPFDIRNYYALHTPEQIHDLLMHARWTLLPGVLSGMTDVEKYDTIENWFIETFGENFMKAYHIGAISDDYRELICENLSVGFGKKDYWHIGRTFNEIINRNLGGVNNAREVNRQRLYGDMSNDEIQDAIRAKFPDKLTNRDLFMMFGEMQSVGVFNDEFHSNASTSTILHWYRSHSIQILRTDGTWCGKTIPWESVLNMPVNKQLLFGVYNDVVYVGRCPPSQDARNFLTRFFGGEIGNGGYFKNAFNIRKDTEFFNLVAIIAGLLEKEKDNETPSVVPDLLAQFMDDLDEHDDRRAGERLESLSMQGIREMLEKSIKEREAYLRERLAELDDDNHDDELNEEIEWLRTHYALQLSRAERAQYDRPRADDIAHLLNPIGTPAT